MYRPDKAGSSTSSSTSFLIISIWPVQVFLPHIRIPVSWFLYFLQSHYQPGQKAQSRWWYPNSFPPFGIWQTIIRHTMPIKTLSSSCHPKLWHIKHHYIPSIRHSNFQQNGNRDRKQCTQYGIDCRSAGVNKYSDEKKNSSYSTFQKHDLPYPTPSNKNKLYTNVSFINER